MPKTKTVALTHPKLKGRTIVVSERSVPIHEKSGWKAAPKSQQPDPDTETKTD